jgi:hypothetical protein|tara:strand:+ start:394 stop:1143 length:750 start_codon:yes stop_codon:yes gene_type:complete
MATTKVVRKKIKRRKKSKMYFGQKTQDAIVKYNSMEPGDPERNKLFADSIYYPIRKIAENLIHTYKFYYFDEPTEQVIEEVVSNMVINMHKYKQDKGKAFSYFSVVAKNYLILNNNKNYKMGKIHDQLDVMDYNRDTNAENNMDNVTDFKLEVFKQMMEYWEENIFKIFKKKKDIAVVDALLYLMRNNKSIENFNKKALYILIREMSGSNTQHITRVINVMKRKQNSLIRDFRDQGISFKNNITGSVFT